MAPRLYTSLAGPIWSTRPSACSGLMKAGVPNAAPAAVSVELVSPSGVTPSFSGTDGSSRRGRSTRSGGVAVSVSGTRTVSA